MEIRRGIVFSRMDIDCCDVTLIVEAIDFAHRSVFFVTFGLLFFFFKWVRMKGVLK